MHPGSPPAAGVAIGAPEMVACVPDGEAQQIVRPFGPDTAALQALADGCVDRGLETVAMASTGVYWMPLVEALAASITCVPGRKSDVLDCPWRQTLHSDGLLAASLRPDAALVALRPLWRPRVHLLAQRAPQGLHRHTALLQMHRPLSPARSEVTGDPGPRLIRVMVAGERHPHPLVALRHCRCKKAVHERALALTGP
jgi:transposase